MKNLNTVPFPFRSKETQKVKQLYVASFPKKERMPFWLMLAMSKLPSTDFLSFYDKEALCGFVYLAKTKKLVFIMFLAVDPKSRSKGYGSRILSSVQSQYPRHKILVSIERCDVDAPDMAQRKRRKEFYLRNGYQETGYLVELAKQKQEILIQNGEFRKTEFRLFFLTYSNGTMLPKVLPIKTEADFPAKDT